MLRFDDEKKMTNAQLAAIEKVNGQISAEIEICIKGINDANKAVVALPALNEHGESVIHGCNMAMYNVAQYWTTRLNALESLMGRAFLEYTNGHSSSDISTIARR